MRCNLCAVGMVLLFASASSASPAPTTKITVSSRLPTEVTDGNDIPLPVAVSELPIVFFDDFSWRSFIALMWPAQPGPRGIPDESKRVSDLDGPRVFETWKSAFEAIPPKGNAPSDWISVDAKTPCNEFPQANSGKARILASFTKFGDVSQAEFGSLAGPLVARNSTYVHYEIKLNKIEYSFLRDNKLYDRATIDALKTPLSFPDGSIAVKVAWREFQASEGPEIRKRYYLTHAHVKNYKTGACEEKELGLVGIHIVQKTPLRPQWVWSSFEHVDNVPSIGQPPTLEAKFALNDPSKPQVLSPRDAPAFLTDATYLNNSGAPVAPPMQVVRQLALHPKTIDRNTRYQDALKNTVWANYMLVTTQWPTNTGDPDGVPFPDDGTGLSMANTTMETYFQNSISCMSCHSSARSANLDFVFFPIVHASSQDPLLNSLSDKFVKAMKLKFDDARKNSLAIERQRLNLR